MRALFQSFQRTGRVGMSGYGFAMVRSQFESWLCTATDQRINSEHAARIFRIFDDDLSGCVDILEFLGGVAMFAKGSFLDKMRLCFELYDFNINGHLSALELTLLMRQTYGGAMKMLGNYTPIKDADVEDLSRHAFNVYDDDKNTAMDVGEFVHWATGNRRVSTLIDVVDCAAGRARGNDLTDDSASEASNEEISDLENEDGFWKSTRSADEGGLSASSTAAAGIEDSVIQEPSLWRTRDSSQRRDRGGVPDASLQLQWVYGYKSSGLGSRNNIHFVRVSR